MIITQKQNITNIGKHKHIANWENESVPVQLLSWIMGRFRQGVSVKILKNSETPISMNIKLFTVKIIIILIEFFKLNMHNLKRSLTAVQ